MKHLSRAEFVDLIGTASRLPLPRRQHLEECDGCRAQADALRAALALAASDEAPEPSPLFWDHFASRVADAVRNEPVDAVSSRGWTARFTPWAAAAAIALLIVATGVWRTTLHAPATPAPVQQPHDAAIAPPMIADDDLDGDEAWAVVREAARDLEWDDVKAAGISAHPGTIDDIAMRMTAEERVELARLVDENLNPKRKGA